MTGNVTIGDAVGDTLTVNATADFNTGFNVDGTITSDGLTIDGDLTVDTDTLYVDSTNDRVGINGASPEVALQVYSADINNSFFESSNVTGTQVFIRNSTVASDVYTQLGFAPANNILGGSIVVTSDEDFSVADNRTAHMELKTRHNGTIRSRLYLDENNTIFNEDSRDTDFRVESDSNSHMLFVDAGNNSVKINSNSTTYDGGAPLQIGNNATTPYGPQIQTDNRTYVHYTGHGGGSANNTYIHGYQIDNPAAGGYLRVAPGLSNNVVSGVQQNQDGLLYVWNSGKATSDADYTPTTSHKIDFGTGGSVVFNEVGADIDFRVESDSNTHALFVDASQDSVGIGGTPNLNTKLDVYQPVTANQWTGRVVSRSNVASTWIGTYSTGTYSTNGLYSHNAALTNWEDLYINAHSDANGNPVSGGNAQTIHSVGTWSHSGHAVFNQYGFDYDFRVESDSQSHALFVDAGNGGVGINVSNPDGAALDVYGYYNANRTAWFRGKNGNAYDTKVQLGVGSYYNTVVSEILLEAGYGDTGTHRGHFIRESGFNNASMYFVRLDRNGSTETNVMRLDDNVTIYGSLSKGSGSFRIDHPLAEMNESHYLQHSFVESPQADNIYRGKVDLVAGQATVNIDTVAGMTDGTFTLLNREVQCFTSNETGWTAVRGSVSGNILTIEAQDNTCTDTISWLVVGERQDQHMYDTSWTDADGKVIVEPTKASLDNQ
jgi:hypothetical protein